MAPAVLSRVPAIGSAPPPALAPVDVLDTPDAHTLPGAVGDNHGWTGIVRRLGAEPQFVARCLALSAENGTTLMQELVASGRFSEQALCRELARACGLPFQEEVDPAWLRLDPPVRAAALAGRRGLPVVGLDMPGLRSRFLVTPRDPHPLALADFARRHPGIVRRVAVVAPETLRQAILRRSREELAREARTALFERHPQFSARFVATAWQGLLVGVALAILPMLFVMHGTLAGVALHAACSVFFLCCVALRVFALRTAHPPRHAALEPVRPDEMPVYSVLVALHREAAVVPQLLLALGKLQWPRSKLEIKLVCEADDRATLDALRAFSLHPSVEVVEVPPGEPRTKPKALAYALPLCSGQFVALYDAEDRPHPLQLVEAWQRFRAGDRWLACVQAPLFVTNGRSGLLARMFAFEYAALFRGMLPWLAGGRLMFPLGGTSNHFRGLM